MKKEGKIGIAIITCNRENFFKKCYSSLPEYIDEIVVINDGEKLNTKLERGFLIEGTDAPFRKQVGACKNMGMEYLLNKNCDFIFTLEDDIFIEDKNVFLKYIKTHLATNIHHFNFGFSQKENLDKNKKPVYKKIIDYGNDVKIVLTQNILGAFTFYTKQCLMQIGLHHKDFNKGHGDHPELTYRAYKHGYTTPFWWFADIYDSWKMIINQSNMSEDSLVRNQINFVQNFREACNTFKLLHGVDMLAVPDVGEKEVISLLKKLKL